MSKDVASSGRIILPKGHTVDPKELARPTGASPLQRKLPPAPGRVERQAVVPEDEILPRPSPATTRE